MGLRSPKAVPRFREGDAGTDEAQKDKLGTSGLGYGKFG